MLRKSFKLNQKIKVSNKLLFLLVTLGHNFCQGNVKHTFLHFKEDIVLNIGAWIGTTTICLSKKFHHVIAVETDHVSLECLRNNLHASDCNNVTICNKPVKDINDSITQSITIKQLIYDYVYTNTNINTHKISLIKCDIKGGEEDVLEDILHFAYYNQCKVYMSFHHDWWKSKKINDFHYLFKYFNIKTTYNSDELLKNPCEYIQQNPFGSLLFEPIEAGILIKNNITSVIIGYNQLTYIRNMVKQLEKYTTDIVIIDNNSNYQPLLDYYKNDFKYTLLRQASNKGYTVYVDNNIQKLVGDCYVLTDPDLEFNTKLPDNFIHTLIDISHYFKAYKVGFALLIDAPDIRTDVKMHGRSVQEWEKAFWKTPLVYPADPSIELYNAAIDTTYCFINKRNKYNCSNEFTCNKHDKSTYIRVAGDYTCKHIPWHKNFQLNLPPGEFESYMSNNLSTNWCKTN